MAGRVDGDIVYATSDFYLDRVKRNQRFDRVLQARTTSTSPRDSWEFRLGAQQIVWGEVVGLFFADVVSARDMREFLLPRFDVIRIPQWAARAEYFADDKHLEFIWIPVPVFDNIGKPGADFYPAPLPSPTPADVAAAVSRPATPRPRSRQLELRRAGQYALFGLGPVGVLLPKLQHAADVLPRRRAIRLRSRSCSSRGTTASGRPAAR